MGAPRNGDQVICRLRLRVGRLEPSTARQRMARVLANVDLRPRHLAPAAVLCVRRLRDPLPGGIHLDQAGGAPPAEWETALQGALDELHRRAVRPARGAVPAQTEAVLFADRAELLACLALDWLAGTLATRWWWRSLYADLDLAEVVGRAWLEAPEYAPAALQQLAEHRRSADFVGALTPREVRALLAGISRGFALPELLSGGETAAEPALAATNDEPHSSGQAPARAGVTIAPEPSPGGRPRAPSVARGEDVPPGPVPPAAPPWRDQVPESASPGLTAEQQCLLGVGLLLWRAPAVVRSRAFVPAVRRWLHASAGAGVPALGRVGSLAPQPPATSSEAVLPRTVHDPRHTTTAGDRQAPSTDQAKIPVTSSYPASSRQPRARAPAVADPLPGAALSDEPAARRPASLPAAADALTTVAHPREATIETGLAGVFYLLNLGLSLGLYGDFTTPAEPGIDLPIWDFLALVGRELIGEAITADPVWPLLAGLSCRPAGEEPGRGFQAPTSWRLPTDWLAPFASSGPLGQAMTRRRVRVRHPAGFLLLDLPLESGEVGQQVRRELAAYPDLATTVVQSGRVAGPRGGTGMKRWLGWLMPYLRVRLQRTLGVEDTANLPRRVCAHRARVFVTAMHVDVVLALDELPIEVRLAGLDRDPGWIPAAGRIVAFHFE